MVRTRWLAFGTLTLLIVGCEGQITRPPASQLKEGLTILDATPDRAMNAAYRKADRVIYIETRVGPLKPEAFRLERPGDPAHEMDVRFVDELGNTFSAQRGGDTFLDPIWNAEIGQVTPVSKERREADFALAQEASGAMQQATLAPAMSEHAFATIAQGSIAPAAFPELAGEAEKLMAQKHDLGYADWHWQVAMVYKTSVVIVGKHHAVAGWNWNNTTQSWDQMLNTCNHGPCATSMGYVCQTNSGWHTWRLTDYFTGEYSGSTSTVSGACATGYNWWSGSGTHNSNDDAWYEMWQIYNATKGNRWGQAGYDNSGNYFACNCSAGCDDWTHTIGCYPSH